MHGCSPHPPLSPTTDLFFAKEMELFNGAGVDRKRYTQLSFKEYCLGPDKARTLLFMPAPLIKVDIYVPTSCLVFSTDPVPSIYPFYGTTDGEAAVRAVGRAADAGHAPGADGGQEGARVVQAGASLASSPAAVYRFGTMHEFSHHIHPRHPDTQHKQVHQYRNPTLQELGLSLAEVEARYAHYIKTVRVAVSHNPQGPCLPPGLA